MLDTFFLTFATAEVIKNKIVQALREANLDINRVLMIGMDGPNVNKAVSNEINTILTKNGRSPLVDTGSCIIHIMHNSYRKGIEAVGKNIEAFVIHIWKWMNLPAR